MTCLNRQDRLRGLAQHAASVKRRAMSLTAASVRTPLSDTSCAAPMYAESPTSSKGMESWANACGLSRGLRSTVRNRNVCALGLAWHSQVVLARLRGGGPKGAAQELDVLCFMLSDLDEAAADPIREASVGKGLRIELCEGLSVEGALKMLEGECELKDVRVWL